MTLVTTPTASAEMGTCVVVPSEVTAEGVPSNSVTPNPLSPNAVAPNSVSPNPMPAEPVRATAGAAGAAEVGPGGAGQINHIVLQGRVTGLDDERVLPSGDLVRAFRVAVRRPPRADGPARSDAINCAAWSADARAVAAELRVGDVIRVDGALRRSFSRRAGVPQNFYEIEVASMVRFQTEH
jgi:single-strand DNA-binding protein